MANDDTAPGSARTQLLGYELHGRAAGAGLGGPDPLLKPADDHAAAPLMTSSTSFRTARSHPNRSALGLFCRSREVIC